LVQLGHGEPRLGLFEAKQTLGTLAQALCMVQTTLKQCLGLGEIVLFKEFVPLLKRLLSNLKLDLVVSVVLFHRFQARETASERGSRTTAEHECGMQTVTSWALTGAVERFLNA
jgi:hypothetical protein